MKRLIATFAFGLTLPIFVSLTAAQSLTTGAINGTVVDQSGAVMARVVVTAKNADTGATRETQTTGSGNFLLAQLDPGRYEVTAESVGFEKTKIGPITVGVSRVASLEFKLKIGSSTATVEVKQEAALIEPSNPNITTTFNAAQLANVPNPGNDLSYVANLAPGALINTNSSSAGGFGRVEFNGLPSIANNFSIDGLDANNPADNTNASGASGLQLGLNAIQEVSINTASYSVDQGRQEAAQINYITKSGTNSFHGNAYEIWNGSAMNARNFFNNLKGITKKPRSNVNEFGASLGGPILKNKLFFFTDLEGIRIVLPTTLTSTLPTSIYQTYVLQQLPLGGNDLFANPQTGSAALPPEPGEVPFYQNMFKLIGNTTGGIPLPVLGCPLNIDGTPASGNPPNGAGCATQQTFSVTPPVSETLFTIKLDYTLNSTDAFWFRFQLNNGNLVTPDPVSSVFDSVSSAPVRSGAAGWTHIFSPSLVNQFNPGLSYNKNVSNIADPSKAHALLPISYAGSTFSTIGNYQYFEPMGSASTVWQLNDNLAWSRGRHALKFGENMRRVLISAFTTSLFALPFEFACTLPEFTYGATCFTNQSFPKIVGDRIASVNLDLYAMDTFRATNKLTFTIGVRTAWNSNPVSRHDAFSRLAGSFGTISHDVNQPPNQVILANQAKGFASTQLLQWQPRGAVAYEVRPNTIFRAGFGIFATTLDVLQVPRNLSGNAPLDPGFTSGLFGAVGGVGIAPGVPGSAVDAAVAANQQFQANFASGALSCASSLSSPSTCVPPVRFIAYPGGDLQYPYSMQWSSSIENQLGNDFGLTVRYLGTRAVKMQYILSTLNTYQTWCQGCFAPLPFNTAPDPRFAGVSVINTGASSSYHALQVTGQKRMSHGLLFQVNYTYSHCLDDTSNGGFYPFSSGTISGAILPVNLKHYYGNCDYDVRHSLNGSYIYELPLHPRRAWLGYAIGGWQVSGTVFLRGGFPVSVYSNSFSNFVPFNAAPALRANLVPGVNPYAKSNIPGLTLPGTIQWLNPNAFQSVIDSATNTCFPTTNVQNCQDGDSGRGQFRGPGFKWTDFDIGKRFKISERIGFKFDAQFYNLFNHPNFFFPGAFPTNFAGNPGQAGTLTGFGVISATAKPQTGLLGGIPGGGDSSVRMIALSGRIEF